MTPGSPQLPAHRTCRARPWRASPSPPATTFAVTGGARVSAYRAVEGRQAIAFLWKTLAGNVSGGWLNSRGDCLTRLPEPGQARLYGARPGGCSGRGPG